VLEDAKLSGTVAFNLTGDVGANRLTRNSGNNTLNGGDGLDSLGGGAGNDTDITYGADTITEASGAGTDTVEYFASFISGASFENLTLAGSAVSGTGNAAVNRIIGNAAANSIDGGGAESDILTGSADKDSFGFTTAPGPANVDTIIDFNVPAAMIRLEGGIFTRIGEGKLARAEFRASNSGTQMIDRTGSSMTKTQLICSGTGMIEAARLRSVCRSGIRVEPQSQGSLHLRTSRKIAALPSISRSLPLYPPCRTLQATPPMPRAGSSTCFTILTCL
jgi:hypothetical protein